MIGNVITHTKNNAVGYLLCDGSAVSRSAYSALFAMIGTTFGEGDGSTTFNLPDLQGDLIIGKQASTIDIQNMASLVSRYLLDGNSQDSKGSNHGTDTGMTYSKADGKIGKGGHFTGAGTYITLPSGVKPTGQFTILALLKASASGVLEAVTCWAMNGSAYGGILLRIESSGCVAIYSAKNTGAVGGTDFGTATSRSNIKDGAWHLVAGVWDGSNLKMYIDGQLETTTPWAYAPAYGATTYCLIGTRKDTGVEIEPFVGSIDDVQFHNSALSAGDILKIYEETFAVIGSAGGSKILNTTHLHTPNMHAHNSGSGSTGGANSLMPDQSGGGGTIADHTHSVSALTVGNASVNSMANSGSASQSIMNQFMTLYFLIEF